MITETGRVVAEKGNRVWVRTIRASACQSCTARSGCGQRVLAAATGGRANQVLVANTVGARVGDDVTIGIDEQALLGASLMVYALPLVLMVLASIAGHQLSAGSDPAAMAGAVIGLATGFLISRQWQRHSGEGFEPKLVRVNRINAETCP